MKAATACCISLIQDQRCFVIQHALALVHLRPFFNTAPSHAAQVRSCPFNTGLEHLLLDSYCGIVPSPKRRLLRYQGSIVQL